ncbi:MAG: iron ABC transporter permease [Dehalococcoidia bacterium]|nr:iron ABC transporter permease [Dehalococcoidia bacterium]
MHMVYPWWRLAVGLVVVVLIGVAALGIGSVNVPPLTTTKILVDQIPFVEVEGDWPNGWNSIIWNIRFPRVVLAGLVGACLAIAGAAYQGLFRNPLAEPGLIGVSSGAALGATVVLVTSVPFYVFGYSLLPIAAFAGGIVTVAVAYTVSRQSNGVPLLTLILAGVAIASLATAVSSLLMIRSDPDVRPLLSWLLGGGLISSQWDDIYLLLPYLVVGALILLGYSRILNTFQVNEEEAKQLGVNVEKTKIVLVVVATLITAASVSVAGIVGFVGLIAPHAVRLIWGQDNRFLLPMAMLAGAGFMIAADLIGRTIANPSELPVGVVTSFCGAPFFLYLLRQRRVVL